MTTLYQFMRPSVYVTLVTQISQASACTRFLPKDEEKKMHTSEFGRGVVLLISVPHSDTKMAISEFRSKVVVS